MLITPPICVSFVNKIFFSTIFSTPWNIKESENHIKDVSKQAKKYIIQGQNREKIFFNCYYKKIEVISVEYFSWIPVEFGDKIWWLPVVIQGNFQWQSTEILTEIPLEFSFFSGWQATGIPLENPWYCHRKPPNFVAKFHWKFQLAFFSGVAEFYSTIISRRTSMINVESLPKWQIRQNLQPNSILSNFLCIPLRFDGQKHKFSKFFLWYLLTKGYAGSKGVGRGGGTSPKN